MPLLEALPEDRLRVLWSGSLPHRHRGGEVVCSTGDPAEASGPRHARDRLLEPDRRRVGSAETGEGVRDGAGASGPQELLEDGQDQFVGLVQDTVVLAADVAVVGAGAVFDE